MFVRCISEVGGGWGMGGWGKGFDIGRNMEVIILGLVILVWGIDFNYWADNVWILFLYLFVIGRERERERFGLRYYFYI